MIDLGSGSPDVLTWVWWGLVVVGVGLLAYVGARLAVRARRRGRDLPQPRGRPAVPTSLGASGPRAILEQRLARGEIDVEEFTVRVRALEER